MGQVCQLTGVHFQKLLQSITVWKLQSAEVEVNRHMPEEASDLLKQIAGATANAWSMTDATDQQQGFFVPPRHREEAGFKYLWGKKLIKKVSHSDDQFLIAKKGFEALRLVFMATSPMSLVEHSSFREFDKELSGAEQDCLLDKMTKFELFLQMLHSGWDESNNVRTPPYMVVRNCFCWARSISGGSQSGQRELRDGGDSVLAEDAMVEELNLFNRQNVPDPDPGLLFVLKGGNKLYAAIRLAVWLAD
eukprot:s2538_g21.t1